MKKIILILLAALAVIFIVKNCSPNSSNTSINGYTGVVSDVEGNVLVLTSGVRARLLGVEANRVDVEMFLRSQFLGKKVVLYADSHSKD